MLQTILHQLWNQRRQNAWIFLELLFVSFFLWTVIDPIYVLTANHSIDKGYDPKGVYVVNIGAYAATDGRYDPAQDKDSLNLAAYWRIVREVRSQPEVESCCISTSWSFPNSNSWNGTRLFADTASLHKGEGFVHAQQYNFVAAEGGNLFHILGMKDARTGGDIEVSAQSRGKAFISERLAQLLFGTTDAVGRKIYEDDKPCEVAGVFRDYKHRDYEQPYPLIVRTFDNMWGGSYMQWLFSIVIRVKPGVDASAFEQRFRNEVGPRLAMGNFYFDKLQEFSEVSKAYAMRSGVSNKLRLQYALTGFAMLCIFLGMVGTFWIRSNARRGEIGVMRSMGASQGCIVRQFLIEAWLLLTVAFVLVIPFLLYHAHTNGLYAVEMSDNFVPNPAYGQNRFGFHFTVVLAISYVLLLVVALVGTYIPVRRAARTLPVEALREE